MYFNSITQLVVLYIKVLLLYRYFSCTSLLRLRGTHVTCNIFVQVPTSHYLIFLTFINFRLYISAILHLTHYTYILRAEISNLNFFFIFGTTAHPPSPSGPWPPHLLGFYITQNDAPQSVGLLWTSDQTST